MHQISSVNGKKVLESIVLVLETITYLSNYVFKPRYGPTLDQSSAIRLD